MKAITAAISQPLHTERHDESLAGQGRLLCAMPPPMVILPHMARKRDWNRP